MHYYQFNIGDYRRDTAHLTPIEHYIYRQLIDWYYLDETPIPKETQMVLRRLCLGNENTENLKNVLSDFFKLTDDGYFHDRINDEINKYHENAEKNRANGKLGGRPKKQQLTENNKPKKTQSVTNGNPTKSENNPNQEPITKNQEPSKNTTNVVAAKGDAKPCPHQEIIELYHKHLPMCPTVKQWTDKRQSLLRQRWKEEADRQDVEWWARFFGYISNSSFLTGRVNTHPDRKPFVVDLEWIIKPSNFVKIIEGRYEDE